MGEWRPSDAASQSSARARAPTPASRTAQTETAESSAHAHATHSSYTRPRCAARRARARRPSTHAKHANGGGPRGMRKACPRSHSRTRPRAGPAQRPRARMLVRLESTLRAYARATVGQAHKQASVSVRISKGFQEQSERPRRPQRGSGRHGLAWQGKGLPESVHSSRQLARARERHAPEEALRSVVEPMPMTTSERV